MNTNAKWVVSSITLSIIFIFTFLKSPEAICNMLHRVTEETSLLAAIIHGIYLALIVTGFAIKKWRNALFSALLLILSGTASIISIVYVIPPNIIIFVAFFILTIVAIKNGELDFGFSELTRVNRIFALASITLGFYYLHWVKAPIFLNALIYSPLGIVNCPTMVAFCGLLCLLKKRGSLHLEFFVSVTTLYFGFFGVMRIGAYIDIGLIAVGMFLIVRLASRIDYQHAF